MGTYLQEPAHPGEPYCWEADTAALGQFLKSTSRGSAFDPTTLLSHLSPVFVCSSSPPQAGRRKIYIPWQLSHQEEAWKEGGRAGQGGNMAGDGDFTKPGLCLLFPRDFSLPQTSCYAAAASVVRHEGGSACTPIPNTSQKACWEPCPGSGRLGRHCLAHLCNV